MLDLFIVAAFVVFSVAVGFKARRQASRGLGDYFLAGRGLRGWQAGTSMAATQFAADTPLLVAGLVATAGIFMVWRLWIYALAFLLMAYVFAALWRRAAVITDAELTELRYSGRGVLALRVVKAIYYGTVLNGFVLAMVLTAAVGIVEAFLPWHLWLPAALYEPWLHVVERSGLVVASVLQRVEPATATANNLISITLILLFTALYSMTGGLRGVVATDLLQFALGVSGTLAFAWVLIGEVGGLQALGGELTALYGEQQAARAVSFVPGWEPLLLAFLTLIGLQWFFQAASDGTGYLAQRAMACADEREARRAGVVFAWLQIWLRSLPWLLIAVGLLVLYPFSAEEAVQPGFAAQRELTFVRGMDELLPPGLRGLLLAGLLAALASTLDTHMNWGAGYWSNDIYRRLICQGWLHREPRGPELVTVARLSNLLVIAIALVIMVHLDSIQQAWHLSLMFGAGVGSVLVLRWLWERINLWSEVAAMTASLVAAPVILAVSAAARQAGWLRGGALATEALELAAMALLSTLAAVAVIGCTPATDARALDAFYRRVRPPGFWSQTARRLGQDPRRDRRRLMRGLTAAALTAASLFLCLYGTARLLIPHPGLPWSVAAAALAAGLALIPAWWRRANR